VTRGNIAELAATTFVALLIVLLSVRRIDRPLSGCSLSPAALTTVNGFLFCRADRNHVSLLLSR
jgi:hypothetical protein